MINRVYVLVLAYDVSVEAKKGKGKKTFPRYERPVFLIEWKDLLLLSSRCIIDDSSAPLLAYTIQVFAYDTVCPMSITGESEIHKNSRH